MTLESRIIRYQEFIRDEYLQGLLKWDEYSTEDLDPALAARLRGGQFKRLVFTGMGCSAIVSDVIRGYLLEQGLDLDIYVVNDYEFRFLVPDSVIEDDATLIVISSYSGHSREPVLALERLLAHRDRILLLTSGGELGQRGREYGVSAVYWRLRTPDREYPLFHVTQYFAILVDLFVSLSMLEPAHRDALPELAAQLELDFDVEQQQLARRIAATAHESNMVMIASPKWHESLLKLCKMHLNEIAMVPATRNFFHEFCHSEVATLTNPQQRHTVLVLDDVDSDDYTRAKTANLVRLLTADVPQNHNIVVHRIVLERPGFLRKFFGTLRLIEEITLELGRRTNTVSRDLISESAGNPWYHSTTIEAEQEQLEALEGELQVEDLAH